jgi:DnaA family protein
MNKPKQLIFPFQINQKASFDSFFCSPDNQNLMTRLADIAISQDANEIIIHGEKGSGKSFLMQAICNELSSSEKQFAFIPMKKAFNMGVEIFQNLGSLDTVCIDDLQLILANQQWETALFNLINECQQSNCSLILSLGGTQPVEESIVLPDLLSRIKRMEFIALNAVQDELFNEAIVFVAQQLEIKIDNAELEFLLKHQTRIFSLLVENIITLDKQAASLKRKITIPLIKETLNI